MRAMSLNIVWITILSWICGYGEKADSTHGREGVWKSQPSSVRSGDQKQKTHFQFNQTTWCNYTRTTEKMYKINVTKRRRLTTTFYTVVNTLLFQPCLECLVGLKCSAGCILSKMKNDLWSVCADFNCNKIKVTVCMKHHMSYVVDI